MARMRVRAYCVDYRYFYISESWLLVCVSLWSFPTSEYSLKTTRRLGENNTSFW